MDVGVDGCWMVPFGWMCRMCGWRPKKGSLEGMNIDLQRHDLILVIGCYRMLCDSVDVSR